MKPDLGSFIKTSVYSEFSEDVHHELEIICQNKQGRKYIEPKFAHKYYDEISVGIDLLRSRQSLKLRVCYMEKQRL
jgi:hypothetical protein